MDFRDAIEALDADLFTLHKTLFQYRTWLALQRQAGVTVDRAGIAVLKTVAHGESGGVRLHDIAEKLGIEAPSVTRTAQHLESEGLIARKPDPKDGRASNLVLTRKGTAQLKKLQKARQAQLEKAIAGWDKAERDTFIRLLHTFNDHLQTIITDKEKENA